MLSSLKFVQGAVSRKDFVPELQHFRIKDGKIRSFNGTLGLCCPIACDLDVAPHGIQFLKAIQGCDETVALHVANNGKLVVRAGAFKTHVDCVDGSKYPEVTPAGESIPLNKSLLPALAYLEPFIAVDASRPWACGILLDGESAYATNNVVLLQFWLGFVFPLRVNVPGAAVRELLRIGKDPVRMQMATEHVSFHYADGSWLRTQLFPATWPDAAKVLSRPSNQLPFPAGFFDALERLAPFADEQNRAYFHATRVATSAAPDTVGTCIELPGLPATGCFNIHQLRNLKGVANTIDFNCYPEPSVFYGDVARGIIVGLRT